MLPSYLERPLADLATALPGLIAEYGPDHVMDAFAARADDIVEACETPWDYDEVLARIDAMLEANGLGRP